MPRLVAPQLPSEGGRRARRLATPKRSVGGLSVQFDVGRHLLPMHDVFVAERLLQRRINSRGMAMHGLACRVLFPQLVKEIIQFPIVNHV